MNVVVLLFVPLVFDFVGTFTPCALGINAVFLGHIAGKPQRQRHWSDHLQTPGRSPRGRIWAASTGLGKGSTFSFTLPVTP